MSEFPEKESPSWWTRPFRLETVNPETLERRSVLSLKGWMVVAAASALLLFLLVGMWFLMGYTPFRKLIPGDYSQLDVREIIELRSKVDEMEEILVQQDNYITTMRGLLSGKPMDSLQHENTYTNTEPDTPAKPVGRINEEIQLRETMEMEDRLHSLRQSIRQAGISTINTGGIDDLMAPVIGPIGKGYDPSVSHYGIDILAPKNTAVKSISKGLVIQSDWTVETGNTIMVLHAGGIISVYKHNSSLLKENYEKVNQGEAVAIIGNTGTLTTGPHVHFELWVDGFPVDPTEYINFQ